MSRTLNVVRMQFVNRQTFVWVPLIVLGGAFLLSLAIFALIPVDGPKYGGGSQAPLWYFFALGITSMSYTFPFSQAMSITRREFFFGTLLAAAAAAVVLSAVFVLGGWVEQLTGGWWMNGYFFYLDWTWANGPLGAGFFFLAMTMLLFTLAFWIATVYKRFGPLGLTVTLVGLGALLLAAFWIIGQLDAWAPVFEAVFGTGAVGLAAWTLPVTAVLVAVGYLTLRRATP